MFYYTRKVPFKYNDIGKRGTTLNVYICGNLGVGVILEKSVNHGEIVILNSRGSNNCPYCGEITHI